MIEPIVKTTIPEEIVESLMNNIKIGLWKPGEQLPGEIELANILGVSRNSVREALKALNLLGIIYSKAGKGTFVSEDVHRKINSSELIRTLLEDTSLYDLMEARMVIESQIAALAAERATEDDKRKLTKAFKKLEDSLFKYINQNKIPNPTNEGLEFHSCIANIANNKILSQFIYSLSDELSAQRSLMLLHGPQDIRLMIQDHEKIYNAILNNDIKSAEEAMRSHLNNTLENIEKRSKELIK